MNSGKRFCTECGNEIPIQSRFCNSCGSPVAVLPAGAPPPPAPPPPPPAPAGAHPAVPPVPPVPFSPPGPAPGRPMTAAAPPGYSPQSTYPSSYGSAGPGPGNAAGPFATGPVKSRSGCGKFLLILLILVLLGGAAAGTFWYLDSKGTMTLPWADPLDTKLFAGRWQAVSHASGGKTTDVSQEKNKVTMELSAGAGGSLSGRLSGAENSGELVLIDLKPLKDARKYEGTARTAKQTTKITLEQAPDTKELVMTVFPPNDKVTVIRFKKS